MLNCFNYNFNTTCFDIDLDFDTYLNQTINFPDSWISVFENLNFINTLFSLCKFYE